MSAVALNRGSIHAPTLAEGLRSGHIYLPISKIDKAKRIVWGRAQVEDDMPDSQDDIVDFDGSKRAFERWAGNVREMHSNKAVGHAVSIYAVPEERAIYVGTYVSRGAQDTWEKCLDGTLNGYSIGGKVVRGIHVHHKGAGRKVHRILDYDLDELSLVDVPANSRCSITMVEKRAFQSVLKARDLIGLVASELIA